MTKSEQTKVSKKNCWVKLTLEGKKGASSLKFERMIQITLAGELISAVAVRPHRKVYTKHEN